MQEGPAQREMLALIVDEAPVVLVALSPDGTVLSWGPSAQSLFGWSSEEAVGQPLDALTGASASDGGVKPLLQVALRDGTARDIVLRRHKDGHLMHVDVAWRTVHDEHGQPTCVVAAKRDVSADQLQRDVATVEERYRDLLDSVPDAIVIVNDVGAIVLFNEEAAKLFGVPASQMVGQPVERLIPSRLADRHAQHRERFHQVPQRRPMGGSFELRGRRHDGSEFPVEVALSPLLIGERRFVMSTVRDLTDRLQLEEAQLAVKAAQRASDAKTEFLSQMSHELRTPLNAVLGFAQLLQIDTRRPLDGTQRHQVDEIVRAGRHLLGMINDLLDISRIESGALALSLEPLALSSVVDDAVAMTMPLANESKVTVATSLPQPPLYVHADRLRLRQVLLNLLSNAVKYNRRGGRVELRATRAGDEVEVAIADTGQGLTAKQIEQLYQPFNRLGAAQGAIEGTGIGLVIAKGLLHSMQGRIDVTSTPGVGTVFTLSLPAAQPLPLPDEQTLRPARPESACADAPHRQVVCVEDNETNVAVLRAALSLRPQWSLVVAPTGADAIALVRQARPALMIVDMQLPDMNGLELARQLDADPATAGIERVALSADATQARIGAAATLGFARYFTKPLDIRGFLAWLDEFGAPPAPASAPDAAVH